MKAFDYILERIPFTKGIDRIKLNLVLKLTAHLKENGYSYEVESSKTKNRYNMSWSKND